MNVSVACDLLGSWIGDTFKLNFIGVGSFINAISWKDCARWKIIHIKLSLYYVAQCVRIIVRMFDFDYRSFSQKRRTQKVWSETDFKTSITFCAMSCGQNESCRDNAAATYWSCCSWSRSNRHLIRKLSQSSSIASNYSSLNSRWRWWEQKIFRRHLFHHVLIRKYIFFCYILSLLSKKLLSLTPLFTELNSTKPIRYINPRIVSSRGTDWRFRRKNSRFYTLKRFIILSVKQSFFEILKNH